MITWKFFKQEGLLSVPVLECPEGCFSEQVFLRDELIIQVALTDRSIPHSFLTLLMAVTGVRTSISNKRTSFSKKSICDGYISIS